MPTFIPAALSGALSFLSVVPKFVYLIPAITIAWSLLIGGTVTSLDISIPFTDTNIPLDSVVQLIADQLATIVNIMPFMEIVFTIFIWGIQVKIMLFIVELYWKITSIFVQS